MKEVHIVMQGKGGVGKSTISRLIYEFAVDRGNTVVAYDADPLNPTLYEQIKDRGNISKVDLLDPLSSTVDPGKFDVMMERILTADNGTLVLIDTGASTFLPFLAYLSDNAIPEMLEEAGYDVFVHTVVTGGTSAEDTISGFVKLATEFGDKTSVIAWENNYFGPVQLGGTSFSELKDVKAVLKAGKAAGLLELAPLSDLHNRAFLLFLKQGKSFDESAASAAFDLMTKQRVKQLKTRFFSAIGPVLNGGEETNG